MLAPLTASSNDMLARAAGPHVEVMERLLAHGAEPSLIDDDNNTVDATVVRPTALAKDGPEEATGGSKDDLRRLEPSSVFF